jgi:hypothetical protein
MDDLPFLLLPFFVFIFALVVSFLPRFVLSATLHSVFSLNLHLIFFLRYFLAFSFSFLCFLLLIFVVLCRVAQSVQCLTTDWTAGVRSPTGAEDFFPLTSASRPALGPTQPPVQWVPGVKGGRGVMLTTHPLLVPRLRKSRSYTSSHPQRLRGVGRDLFYLYVHENIFESVWRWMKFCALKTSVFCY